MELSASTSGEEDETLAGRIRSVKPELLEDEAVATLSHGAWRLFVSLFLLADDYGNARGDARYLNGAVFWGAQVSVDDVTRFLAELSRLVVVYDVRGQRYVSLMGWDKHQRVDHPGKPRVPGSDDAESTLVDLSAFLGNVPENLAKGSESLAPDLRSDLDHDHDHDHMISGQVPSLPGLGKVPEADAGAPLDKAKRIGLRAKVEATSYVEWFNRRFERNYRVIEPVIRDIKKLLMQGYTQKDMRKVAWFKRSKWLNDKDMAQYLRPSTLLRPSKFGEYLDDARSSMFGDNND
jgi:uncharacterized phage protein (TIGR02220 family)